MARILERKAKIAYFNADEKKISIYIPPGGLRDPQEILADFTSELKNADPSSSWVIETPRYDVGVDLKTLYEEKQGSKEEKIQAVKDNSVIKRILNDLPEAEIVNIIEIK